MKEIAVISGKGGTGKTSLVASFASLASLESPAPPAGNPVLADCDVDAPDLHLLFCPEVVEKHEFRASRKAFIDPVRCTRCGLCEQHCRFGAIRGARVDPLSCEGCGVCRWVCPEGAVTISEELSGCWYVSETRYGAMVHARLEPGEENSGRLVAVVRGRAREIAGYRGARFLLTDGPPGIGCPVISTVTGADLAVVVTEPTLSGKHDLGRALDVCRYFRVPAVVCINRCDLHPEGAEDIERECRSRGVPVAGRIPYDPAFTEAIVAGRPLVEFSEGEAARAVRAVWDEVAGLAAAG